MAFRSLRDFGIKTRSKKFVHIAMFMAAIMLSWFGGVFDGPIALYEDFFAPRTKFEVPLKLEIPVGIKPTNKTKIFQLKLRRKHGVYVHFISENGVPKSVAPTQVSGQIILKSSNGKKVLNIYISPNNKYGYSIEPIHTFQSRLFGVGTNITIEVKDLKITSPYDTDKQGPFTFRIIIFGEEVFFH